jgi:hypothetical protein
MGVVVGDGLLGIWWWDGSGGWRWLVGHLLEGGVVDVCNGLSLLVYMGW